MGRASRVTTKDRDSSDVTVFCVDCRDLPGGDPGGLGSATRIGKGDSRSSPTADLENSSKSGNATGRPPPYPVDHLRCTTTDANDPRSGDRRTDGGLSGFYPGILRLVCFDGTEWSES